MKRILQASFFNRPADRVARDLLGTYLVRRIGKRETAFQITETEAYLGPHDRASHARFGKTARTAPMFGPPGTIYVYFTYGMHWMLNVACLGEGVPSAVLIRGTTEVRGPARLTKLLAIDGTLSGRSLGRESGLWVEERCVIVPKSRIGKTPRVGIDYAGEWSHKPLRFVLKI